MSPIQVPVVPVYGGDTLVFPVYVIKDASGIPIDLSAWDWEAKWRRTAQSATGIVITIDDSEANAGKFTLSVAASLTRNMKGAGVWDLQGTLGDVVQTWLAGNTKYIEDVTRAE